MTTAHSETAPWPIPGDVCVVRVNGYPLAYVEAGRGKPVLLIHGSLNDYRVWANQIPAFAASFRVIAVSLRHYYPERWDGRGSTFSLAQHASDLAAFVKALGLGQVHLVGHSRGGAVAYLLARDAPELVRSLVLAEPRGLEDLVPDAANEEHSSIKSVFEELQSNLRDGFTFEAARAFIDSLNGCGSWDTMPDLQKSIILDNIGTAVDTGELPGMRGEDIAHFSFPILLVRGERCLARYELGLEAMRRFNPAIGNVVVIPGAPHGMHRTHPDAFNLAVLNFLKHID